MPTLIVPPNRGYGEDPQHATEEEIQTSTNDSSKDAPEEAHCDAPDETGDEKDPDDSRATSATYGSDSADAAMVAATTAAQRLPTRPLQQQQILQERPQRRIMDWTDDGDGRTRFEIYVSKDTFKFNAAHFVAYPGFRERLHGHSYRASVRLLGSRCIGRDGYVLDFGCVKTVVKEVCKEMNEYFIVPMMSEVLKITVVDDEDEDEMAKEICGDCNNDEDGDACAVGGAGKEKEGKRKFKRKYPGSVTIECEDGSTFIFPRQDCLLLPIMHSTAEELSIYLYGKILQKLNSDYLRKRGVKVMEVTVSEAKGQDAVFRRQIPLGSEEGTFDVGAYISREPIPPMPCPTETEAVKRRKLDS